MAILIANLGTSDLTVSVGSDYFPVAFYKYHPNLNQEGMTPLQNKSWKERDEYIQHIICDELDILIQNDKFSFRELTLKLSQNYNQWHSRIYPGRIAGVIKEAKKKYNIKIAYIFVTDQNPNDPEQKKGYSSDTIVLFDILQQWCLREIPEVSLLPIPIRNISGRDEDGLLHFYHVFFDKLSLKIDPDEVVLISIKGGTNQMQLALRIQAIASIFQNQIFIDPSSSSSLVANILQGKDSECVYTSYWQYMKTQKYQTIKLLLDRWDFDGAAQILNKWSNTLDFLIRSGISGVSSQKINLDNIVKMNHLALCCLNLDVKQAASLAEPDIIKIKTEYDKILNLYTQCRIYWQLNQVANFLYRLGSLCEEVLHQILIKKKVNKYLDNPSQFDDFDILRSNVESEVWNRFVKKEEKQKPKDWDFSKKSTYKLFNRFSKWNFLNAMIEDENDKDTISSWNILTDSLDKLDYWVEKRNSLVHSTEGVSKERMTKVLRADCKKNDKVARRACEPEKIESEIETMIINVYQILNISTNSFVGTSSRYYIYSEVREWVINKLMTEGLE